MNQTKAMWVAGAILTGVIATVFVSCTATPAHATDEPYILTAWQINTPGYEPGDSVWLGPEDGDPGQTNPVTLTTSSTDLTLIQPTLACGHWYQIDLYNNDEITASLLLGGVLYGPSNPQESPATGVDPWYIESWYSGDCKPQDIPFTETTPPTCESPFTVTLTGVYSHTLVDGVWVQDTEPSILTSSKAPADVAGCESDAPPTLASTGFEPWHLWLIPAGLLLLAAGIVLVLFTRTYSANHRGRHVKEGK